MIRLNSSVALLAAVFMTLQAEYDAVYHGDVELLPVAVLLSFFVVGYKPWAPKRAPRVKKTPSP